MQIKNLKHYFRQRIRQIKNKKIIYFISFPKVGRTWIELMFAKAYSELTGEIVEDIVNKKINFNKEKGSGEKIPMVLFGHGFLNSKICFGNFFPKKFYKKRHIIFLVRDPRDILISHFYHDKFNYNNFEKGLHDFIHFDNQKAYNPKSERYGIKAIVNYFNAFIENKHLFKTFDVVYYEDLKQDVGSVMKELFLKTDLNIDEDLLKNIIAYGHIDNMRKLEQSNELNWYALQSSGKASKVRKGKSGGYKEELTIEDIDFLNNYIKEHLNPYFNRYIY